MMENTSVLKPSILVDMRKNRIRIHKNTLRALGNPDFVVLIINPDEHTLGIKCSMLDDKLAHRIHKNTMKNDCELHSKPLMTALHRLCPDWDEKESYKLEGKVIADENMAVFSMKNFTVLGR